MVPIGADFREILKYSKALLVQGSPYILPRDYYPPLESVFFLPLVNINIERAYFLITLINYLCFIAISFLFPLLSSPDRHISPVLVFILITGLFSYGLLFELERGQFDLIVMTLCFGGLYIYHHSHPRFRFFAYLLFVLSVQIKLYPVIFILCFLKDSYDWGGNLKRWGGLILANIAGLFMLGPKVFFDFIDALNRQLSNPTFIWVGNHSIASYVTLALPRMEKAGPAFLHMLASHPKFLEYGLLLFYLLCFAGAFLLIYRHHLNPFNPNWLLICTIGAMVIPSTSHDYKLSILAAPVAIFLNSMRRRDPGGLLRELLQIFLIVMFAIAYSTTLFIHTGLPFLLTSNFPALMVIGIAAVLLMYLRETPRMCRSRL